MWTRVQGSRFGRPIALFLILGLGVGVCVWLLANDENTREPQRARSPGEGSAAREAATLLGRPGAPGSGTRAGDDRGSPIGQTAAAGASLVPGEIPGPSLRGRLVDEAGKGIAGVSFTATFQATHLSDGSAMPADWKERPPASLKLLSDANGAFATSVAFAAGSVVGIHFWEVPEHVQQPAPRRFGFRDEPIEIVLKAGASISGHILPHPEFGRPLGTQVSLYWLEGGARQDRTLKLDESARFQFSRLPPTARFDIVALPAFETKAMTLQIEGRSVQFGAEQLHFRSDALGVALDVAPGRQDVEIVLGSEDGAALRCQIVDEKGAPLAERVLYLVSVPPAARQDPRVVTGTDGRVNVRGLRPGSYRIRPHTLRDKPPWIPQTIQVPFTGNRLAFARAAARRVHGQVVGAGSLAGFRVVSTDPTEGKASVTLTDAAGHFEFTTFAASLDLRAERFGDDRFAFLAGLTPGETEARLILDGGTTIEGRVLDVNGHPLRGEGWVRAFNNKASLRTAIPDGGRFRLTGLPAGRYTVQAGGGRSQLPATRKNVAGGTVDVILTIPEQR